MCCRYSSIVSSTLDPEVGGRSKRLKTWRRASVWTRIVPGLPRILESCSVLEPVQPGVVEADIAEQVRRQLLVGIEAPALLDEADTVEIQRRDATGLLGRNLAADVGEGTAGSKAIGERLTISRPRSPRSA